MRICIVSEAKQMLARLYTNGFCWQGSMVINYLDERASEWWKDNYFVKTGKEHTHSHRYKDNLSHSHTNTHLGGSYVGYSQLSLVVQHLFKVGNVPGGICRVTMKTLRERERDIKRAIKEILYILSISSSILQKPVLYCPGNITISLVVWLEHI